MFESFLPRKEVIFNLCWYNAEIGDTLPEDNIYQYVEQLHRNEEDFIDGNIGERIEQNPEYILEEVYISEISIDEYDLDDDYVNDYMEKYKESNNYPPIVLDGDRRHTYGNKYTVIDGTHRVNALNNIGQKTIKAWVGK